MPEGTHCPHSEEVRQLGPSKREGCGTENTLNAITFGICELMTERFWSTFGHGTRIAVELGYRPEVAALTR